MKQRRLKLLNQLIDCLVAAKITARILMSDSEADAKIKGRYTRLYYGLIVEQLDGMVSALESFKYWTETVEQEPVPIRGYISVEETFYEIGKGFQVGRNESVIAWKPLGEPYEAGGEEE